jgi:hypothetical protein
MAVDRETDVKKEGFYNALDCGRGWSESIPGGKVKEGSTQTLSAARMHKGDIAEKVEAWELWKGRLRWACGFGGWGGG